MSGTMHDEDIPKNNALIPEAKMGHRKRIPLQLQKHEVMSCFP